MLFYISDIKPFPETAAVDKEPLGETTNGVVDSTFDVGDSLDGSTISPMDTLAASSAAVENVAPATAEDSSSVVSADIVQDTSTKLPPAASATAVFAGLISIQSVPGSNRTETLPSLPEPAQGAFVAEVVNSLVSEDDAPARSGSPPLVINKNAVILSDVNQNGTSAFLSSVNLEDPVSRLDSSKSQPNDSQVRDRSHIGQLSSVEDEFTL